MLTSPRFFGNYLVSLMSSEQPAYCHTWAWESRGAHLCHPPNDGPHGMLSSEPVPSMGEGGVIWAPPKAIAQALEEGYTQQGRGRCQVGPPQRRQCTCIIIPLGSTWPSHGVPPTCPLCARTCEFVVSATGTVIDWYGSRVVARRPSCVRAGGVVIFALGVVYLVIGLAILNDYYFMAALGSLSRRLRLSDDVAGAQPATA